MHIDPANTPLAAAAGFVQYHLNRGLGRTKIAEMLRDHSNHGTVLDPAELEQALEAGWLNYLAARHMWDDYRKQARGKHGKNS